jgi:glutathione peroxidase
VNVHSFTVGTADGDQVALSEYSGQVLLIVNVASKCGLTPQYEGLEALQQRFGTEGLQVLGFPSNQFGGQEPGTDAEIQEFCTANYSVTFPVFGKIDVNGADADPLYQYLRAADPGDLPEDSPLYGHLSKSNPQIIGTDSVKWNFTKFLVARDGTVIKRYESAVTPDDIAAELPAILG